MCILSRSRFIFYNKNKQRRYNVESDCCRFLSTVTVVKLKGSVGLIFSKQDPESAFDNRIWETQNEQSTLPSWVSAHAPHFLYLRVPAK